VDTVCPRRTREKKSVHQVGPSGPGGWVKWSIKVDTNRPRATDDKSGGSSGWTLADLGDWGKRGWSTVVALIVSRTGSIRVDTSKPRRENDKEVVHQDKMDQMGGGGTETRWSPCSLAYEYLRSTRYPPPAPRLGGVFTVIHPRGQLCINYCHLGQTPQEAMGWEGVGGGAVGGGGLRSAA
jgi:hypothetical protein